MTQRSIPWTGTTTGDAGPYSSANWANMHSKLIGAGSNRPEAMVISGSGANTSKYNALHVQASSPADTNINLKAGAALIQGFWYETDADIAFPIAANGSGNPRIDSLVLRVDWPNQTVRAVIKQGTPAVSPAKPALTQTYGVLWEASIADIAVANGFVSLANSTITNNQVYLPAADSNVLVDLLNNAGTTLSTGELVVWDYSTQRAVKQSTTGEDKDLAGVWVGTTANGGYGRAITEGFGYVLCKDAVAAIGTPLYHSTSAKQATITPGVTAGILNVTRSAYFAIALETTAGAGLVYCYIKVQKQAPAICNLNDTTAATSTSNSFVRVDATNCKMTITPRGKVAIFAFTVQANMSVSVSDRMGLNVELPDGTLFSAGNMARDQIISGGCLTGVITNMTPGVPNTIYLQWKRIPGDGSGTLNLESASGYFMEIL